MSKPCECDKPGWCARHQMNKPQPLWERCRDNDKYRQIWDENVGRAYVAQPSFLDKVKSLGVEAFNFVKHGLPIVPTEEYNARLGIGGCKDCDKRAETNQEDKIITCSICGCNMNIKAGMQTTQCPHPSGSRWPINLYSDKSSWAPPCGGCGRH